MEANNSNQSWHKIAQMLIQIAMGNYNVSIESEKNNVERSLNHFVKELRKNSTTHTKPNTYFSLKTLINIIIITDEKLIIKAHTPNFNKTLGYNSKPSIGRELKEIITQQSHSILKKGLNKLVQTIIELQFLTDQQYIVPLKCTIINLEGTNHYAITSIAIDWETSIIIGDLHINELQEDLEINIAKKLRNYILQNLSKPLPSTKQLCRIIGTNDFTLKQNFKKEYNSSIYQFYNSERLKRANLLIQQTNLTLKEIAFNSGFSDYTNFYKAFKKKYNCTPNQVFRKVVKV